MALRRCAVTAILLVCAASCYAITEHNSMTAGRLVLNSHGRSQPMAMGVFRASLLRSAGVGIRSTMAGRIGARGARLLALRAVSPSASFVKAAATGTVTLIRKIPPGWNKAMTKYPLHVCGALEGLRYLAGDVIAQRVEAGKTNAGSATSKLNLERLGIFTFWGTWYGAGLGYWSYHELYPRLFGIVGMRAALATAAMDVFVTCPFIYYPIWHCYKLAGEQYQNRDKDQGNRWNGASNLASPGSSLTAEALGKYGRELVTGAAARYRESFVQDNLAMIAVWMPLHVINFRFIPLQHRFPFIAVTGLVWTTTFSFLQFS